MLEILSQLTAEELEAVKSLIRYLEAKTIQPPGKN